MGISGLTTFISTRPHRFLEYYELHDTYLVIDGNNVRCQIYNLYAKCNCAFGGDYDKYAECVSEFFNNLLKCNVTPLVIFDGALEDKKMRTAMKRVKQKIHAASSFCPLSQQKKKFFPLFLTEVFKNVLKEKNIRHMQCLFEADNAIASTAKILNCPVLSYDSDFYIYGSLYIPFNTLDYYIIKNTIGEGYVMHCKIYKTENLLNSFNGINESMLPLAAILLGNDYVKRGTFKNFFRHLKLQGASRKKHNYQQQRIEKTFIWLSRHTLEKAIIEILSRLVKPIRQRILNIIETNINSYTNASVETLIPLGFSKDYVAQVNTHHLDRIFKFNGDINSLTYIEDICEEEDIDTSEEEETEEEIEAMNAFNESESMSTNALVSNLPIWFVNEFLMAKYPTYFMDMIIRRLYVCPVQIEDYSYPSSITISLKIISVIFGLLKSGINDKICYMKCVIRDRGKAITQYYLKGTQIILSCPVPSIFNLRDIPLFSRREILNETLGFVDTECINEFPSEWMLYIICIKYWIKQQDSSTVCNSCIYSILVCMLFNIIDSKIGKYRVLYNFQRKYGKKLQTIEKERKANSCEPNDLGQVTINEALGEIDPDDCILAAPFFMSHFEMDKKLYTNPKKYNKFIVYTFAKFQSCLCHSMELNALLEEPYTQPKVEHLFNGTLLYNLCTNFQTRGDIKGYINTVLQKSPSLLRFFNIFLSKVKLLFPLLPQQQVNSRKKHKKRSKRLKSDQNPSDSNASEYFSTDENLDASGFYDLNNSFSLLNFVT